MKNVFVIDVETGGLDPKENSILSIAGVDINFETNEISPLFHLYINEGNINVTARAMQINKISLETIAEKGYSPKNAIKKMRSVLNDFYGDERSPLTICGHNVAFDHSFLKRLYSIANENMSKDFSFRKIDTMSLMFYLQLAEKARFNSMNLDGLLEFCNEEVEEKDRHTAMGDALATAKALMFLVNTLKEGK